MTVNAQSLSKKIKEIHPEIDKYNLEMAVSYDKEKDAWIVTLTKGKEELYTHLETKDALDCLEGKKCVYLGSQIGQFVEAYCLGSQACEV